MRMINFTVGLVLAFLTIAKVNSLQQGMPRTKASTPSSYGSSPGIFSSFEGRSWSSPSSSSGGSSWGSGGRGGGRGGGGRGGRGGRFGRPRMDDRAQLKFSKTIKIDPENKTPVADMNFSPATRRVLEEKGFTDLTPVQSQSFDYIFDGVDIVARSRTGTGKTLAFGLPLIEKVVKMGLNERRSSNDGLPLILILEPTRELAMQVAQELGSVCAAHKMRVQAIFGGVINVYLLCFKTMIGLDNNCRHFYMYCRFIGWNSAL